MFILFSHTSLTLMLPTQFDSLSRYCYRSQCHPAHSIWPSFTFFPHSSTYFSIPSYFCTISLSLTHFLILFLYFVSLFSRFLSSFPLFPFSTHSTLFTVSSTALNLISIHIRPACFALSVTTLTDPCGCIARVSYNLCKQTTCWCLRGAPYCWAHLGI